MRGGSFGLAPVSAVRASRPSPPPLHPAGAAAIVPCCSAEDKSLQDRPIAAAGAVLSAMAIIGFIDQFVAVIAETSSLWTFHLLRSAMMWALAVAWLTWRRERLRSLRPARVAARSVVMSCAMVLYFGSLGFLPVAEAAAGLFTAPLWVLVIGALAFGRPVGPRRTFAAVMGFGGVLLVLAPDPATAGWISAAPVLAGLFYAGAAIATRAWCDGEAALTLALGVFAALAVWGTCGIAVAAWLGTGEGFLGRGWVTPTSEAWLWIGLQAGGSLGAVVLLTRGYQMAEASVASVFEYSVLGFTAFFGWLLRGETLGPIALVGLVLIVLGGTLATVSTRAASKLGSAR